MSGFIIIALGATVATTFLGRDPINRAVLTFGGAAASALALLEPVSGVVLVVGAIAAYLHYELPHPSPALAGFAAALALAFVDEPESVLPFGLAAPLLLVAVFGGQLLDWYTRRPIDLETLSRASQAANTVDTPDLSVAAAAPHTVMSEPALMPAAVDAVAPVDTEAPMAVAPVRAVEVITPGPPAEFVTIGATPRLLRSSDAKLPHAATMTTAAHMYEGYQHDGYTVRAASHIGTKHMAGGGPRQDSVALSRTSDGRYIVAAVADGVGSAKFSAVGSEWAARTAVRLVVHRYDSHGEVSDGSYIARIASEMIQRVASTVLGEGIDPNDLSTTLVTSVIDTTSGKVLVYRVGDSGASVRRPEGWQHCFDDAGDVEAATNALPTEAPEVESWFGELGVGDCILLMTDGVGDLIHHAPDVASALHHLTAEPGTAQEFSSIVGFQRQQAHDDQSAIGVWRGLAS